MEKKKEISPKSTKNEILEAYNELFEKVKEQKPMDRQAIKKKEEEKQIVKDASQQSSEKIIKGLADLKLDIGKSLDSLEEKLVAQYKKLTELQQAINIETKNLEEVYEIKLNTDSLAAVLLAQKEKKAGFEADIEEKKRDFETKMTEKKSQWEKEQWTFESAKKEREAQTKKERQREEEEYSYNLKLNRKKDTDAYEAKKAILEKGIIEKKAAVEKEMVEKKASVEKELVEKKAAVEKNLSERESVVSSKEKEFEELKTQVDTFPKQLEKAVKDAEKAVIDKLEFKYKHEAQLAVKEIEGERKLYKQSVEALESKIQAQQDLIGQITQKADEAGKQVQHIAVKAIESASSQRVIAMNYEKKLDDASKSKE